MWGMIKTDSNEFRWISWAGLGEWFIGDYYVSLDGHIVPVTNQVNVECRTSASCVLAASLTRRGELESEETTSPTVSPTSSPNSPTTTTCLTRTITGVCWRLCGPQCAERNGNCPGIWNQCWNLVLWAIVTINYCRLFNNNYLVPWDCKYAHEYTHEFDRYKFSKFFLLRNISSEFDSTVTLHRKMP